MSTINVLDSVGATIPIEKPLVPGQALMAASRPVVIASDQSAIPVSGTVTANAGTGTFAVSGTFWQATQPVSGTFWQATQPVSNAGTFAVQAAQSGTWNIGSITTLPALVAGTALVGKVGLDQTTPGTTNAVSLSHIGSTAAASGNGVVGAGVQRVAIASDNTAFSVNAVQSGTWNITNISGTVSLPTGAATSANQSTLNTNIGAIADAVVANGATGSIASYLRTIKDAATDTTTVSPVKIDQTTDGTTNAVAVKNSPAGNTAKTYAGTFNVAATALTRPANTTAYTALDSISNNATAGSVTANSVSLSDTNDHPIDIAEILLVSTDTGPGTAAIQIRCHLFNSDPTASTGVVGGDNAAWSNKQAGWVGSFSGTMRAFSDGSRGVLIADEGTLRLMNPVSGAKTIYWQLQTIGAFTPSANSTTFTPTFKGFQARTA